MHDRWLVQEVRAEDLVTPALGHSAPPIRAAFSFAGRALAGIAGASGVGFLRDEAVPGDFVVVTQSRLSVSCSSLSPCLVLAGGADIGGTLMLFGLLVVVLTQRVESRWIANPPIRKSQTLSESR